MSQVGNLQVPQKKLQDLYEHVVLEMTEAKELDVARTLLRQTQVMSVLRKEDERRYLRLENLMGRVFVDASDLYPETTRDKRRSKIASDLAQEVSVIPPSRLMTIVGQALKWQRLQGALPDGAEIDLLRGVAVGKLDEEVVRHLRQRLGVLLVRDNVAMLCARTPTFSPAEIDGDDDS